jgi:hypothetical protein
MPGSPLDCSRSRSPVPFLPPDPLPPRQASYPAHLLLLMVRMMTWQLSKNHCKICRSSEHPKRDWGKLSYHLEKTSVHCEFDRISSSSRPQVIHPSFQALAHDRKKMLCFCRCTCAFWEISNLNLSLIAELLSKTTERQS